MSGETVTTIVGYLTADPELRFTPSKRTVIEMEVDEVGLSLRHASAKVTKARPVADPWATSTPTDEPPF